LEPPGEPPKSPEPESDAPTWRLPRLLCIRLPVVASPPVAKRLDSYLGGAFEQKVGRKKKSHAKRRSVKEMRAHTHTHACTCAQNI